MLGAIIESVRRGHPLVHNITNYVTVNDAANAVLAHRLRAIPHHHHILHTRRSNVC